MPRMDELELMILAEFGGDPLEDSGFETEEPEPDFDDEIDSQLRRRR